MADGLASLLDGMNVLDEDEPLVITDESGDDDDLFTDEDEGPAFKYFKEHAKMAYEYAVSTGDHASMWEDLCQICIDVNYFPDCDQLADILNVNVEGNKNYEIFCNKVRDGLRGCRKALLHDRIDEITAKKKHKEPHPAFMDVEFADPARRAG